MNGILKNIDHFISISKHNSNNKDSIEIVRRNNVTRIEEIILSNGRKAAYVHLNDGTKIYTYTTAKEIHKLIESIK